MALVAFLHVSDTLRDTVVLSDFQEVFGVEKVVKNFCET